MITIVSLDANVILRYFLADHEEFFRQTQVLFLSAQNGDIKLYVDEVILAEVVWTLTSFHHLLRSDFCSKLSTIVSQPFVVTKNKKALLAAISLYEQTNVDYVDAWLAAISKTRKYQIATFDNHFKKLKAKLHTW